MRETKETRTKWREVQTIIHTCATVSSWKTTNFRNFRRTKDVRRRDIDEEDLALIQNDGRGGGDHDDPIVEGGVRACSEAKLCKGHFYDDDDDGFADDNADADDRDADLYDDYGGKKKKKKDDADDDDDDDDDNLFGDDDKGIDNDDDGNARARREARQAARQKRLQEKRKARLRRSFEPVQLAEHFCTDSDDAIRMHDAPKRSYVRLERL